MRTATGGEKAVFPRPRDRCSSAGSRRCSTSWSLGRRRQGRAVTHPVPCDGEGRSTSPFSLPRWLREAAFRRATPLDHITPAPLNIATARLAGVMRGLSHGGGWVRVGVTGHPTADCWNAVGNAGFRAARSYTSRLGFRGIWRRWCGASSPACGGSTAKPGWGRVTGAVCFALGPGYCLGFDAKRRTRDIGLTFVGVTRPHPPSGTSPVSRGKTAIAGSRRR